MGNSNNNSLELGKSEFGIHPSKKLKELYEKQNFQGAKPENADIIFVGRDPNWNAEIENLSIFPEIAEYLEDGINYWMKNKFHHPFLHPEYSGDGWRYHRMFSNLKIDPKHASRISFVEIIGSPTTGMSKSNNRKFKEILLSEDNISHLRKLDQILFNDEKLIFIAWGLLDDFKFINKKIGLFDRISSIKKEDLNRNILNSFDNIYIHKHFSDSISNEIIDEMSMVIKNRCY